MEVGLEVSRWVDVGGWCWGVGGRDLVGGMFEIIWMLKMVEICL